MIIMDLTSSGSPTALSSSAKMIQPEVPASIARRRFVTLLEIVKQNSPRQRQTGTSFAAERKK